MPDDNQSKDSPVYPPAAWALEFAAQAWCTPETSMIEMDSRLAVAFARILEQVVHEHTSN